MEARAGDGGVVWVVVWVVGIVTGKIDLVRTEDWVWKG